MSTASEDCGDVENPKTGLPHFHNHYYDYYFRSKNKKNRTFLLWTTIGHFKCGLTQTFCSLSYHNDNVL